MVEEDRPHVVQVAVQGEETSPGLIRPDLDLVVVPSRDEQRLSLVEVDASDRTIMFLETIDEGSHTIIP